MVFGPKYRTLDCESAQSEVSRPCTLPPVADLRFALGRLVLCFDWLVNLRWTIVAVAAKTKSAQAKPSPDHSRQPTKTPGPFRPGSTEMPKQLVGSWRGRMRQGEGAGLQIYPMKLKLKGASNDVGVTGRSDYPTLKCAGDLIVTEITSDTVRLTEKITEGTGCVYTVYLKVHLPNRDRIKLTYSSDYDGYAEGSATLMRDQS
jgi:hypothetical protein